MNDGGMDAAKMAARRGRTGRTALPARCFYDVDVAQTDVRMYGGGAQDNGTIITTGRPAQMFFEIDGGDGGWMLIDPTDVGHFFASVNDVQVDRFRSSSGWTAVNPPEPDADSSGWSTWTWTRSAEHRVRGHHAVANEERRRLVEGLLGSPRRQRDYGHRRIARDSKCISVGTDNGGFFRSTDGGNS